MARIYYHQNQLAGNTLNSQVIDLKNFDELFERAEQNLFEFSAPEPVGFFKKLFGQSAKPQFKFVRLTRDGFAYNTSEGDFYLPVALIFYDVDDANFPSVFYFIAKIGEQLELRKCQAGKGVKWYQIPDLHEAVTDSSIIQKIEQSFITLKQEVVRIYQAKPEPKSEQNNQQNQQPSYQLNQQPNYPQNHEVIEPEEDEELKDLAPELKEAYLKLADIALKNHPQKAIVIEQIQQLKQADEDGFFHPLDALIEHLWQEDIRLFVSMDWKQEVTDLQWHLENILKDNWQIEAQLPDANTQFEQDVTVSDDGVFALYTQALLPHGLTIGHIDTDSDAYVFLVHAIQDMTIAQQNVEVLGYRYLSV